MFIAFWNRHLSRRQLDDILEALSEALEEQGVNSVLSFMGKEQIPSYSPSLWTSLGNVNLRLLFYRGSLSRPSLNVNCQKTPLRPRVMGSFFCSRLCEFVGNEYDNSHLKAKAPDSLIYPFTINSAQRWQYPTSPSLLTF